MEHPPCCRPRWSLEDGERKIGQDEPIFLWLRAVFEQQPDADLAGNVQWKMSEKERRLSSLWICDDGMSGVRSIAQKANSVYISLLHFKLAFTSLDDVILPVPGFSSEVETGESLELSQNCTRGM